MKSFTKGLRPLCSLSEKDREELLKEFPNLVKQINKGLVSINDCFINEAGSKIVFTTSGHTFQERTHRVLSGTSYGIEVLA